MVDIYEVYIGVTLLDNRRTYEMEFSKGSTSKAPGEFLISLWGLFNLNRL
jgi:hypothetical protein